MIKLGGAVMAGASSIAGLLAGAIMVYIIFPLAMIVMFAVFCVVVCFWLYGARVIYCNQFSRKKL